MIDKYAARYLWLLTMRRLSIEEFLPFESSFERLSAGGSCNDNTTRDITNIKRLKGAGRAHISALIPELNPHFLAIDFENLQ